MLIDHIGATFFPSIAIFRIIGRFSFPLFILLLVDGEQHTRNFGQYCLRLLLLGMLSQPIFWFLFHRLQWNILFALLLGLVCLRLVRRFPQWQLLIWLIGGAIAQLMLLEYRAYGIIAIALTHSFRSSALWWAGWIGLHLGLLMIDPGFATLQFPAVFAPFLFYLANRRQGQNARWFYLFYPLHLFILWLLQQVLAA